MNINYPQHCVCTLDLHRKMRAVQEFWNSTQIQKGKKKMKTNQKTSSEPQEAKCMQTVIQNKQGKYFSQWERVGKKLKTWIGILSISKSWWWYFIELAKNRFVCMITFLMHKLVLFMNWWWDLFSNLKNKNISLYFLILFAF